MTQVEEKHADDGSVIIGFDYAALTATVRKEVQDEAAAIQKLIVSMSRGVVQIGLRLKHVRETLGRKCFNAWLYAEFRWSQPTASNYMRAAARFSEIPCIDRFQSTALYVLSRKNAPDAARDEAVRRATKGELITKSHAEQIVRRHHHPVGKVAASLVGRIGGTFKRLEADIPSLQPDDRAHLADELRRILALLEEHAAPVRSPNSGEDIPTTGRKSGVKKKMPPSPAQKATKKRPSPKSKGARIN